MPACLQRSGLYRISYCIPWPPRSTYPLGGINLPNLGHLLYSVAVAVGIGRVVVVAVGTGIVVAAVAAGVVCIGMIDCRYSCLSLCSLPLSISDRPVGSGRSQVPG